MFALIGALACGGPAVEEPELPALVAVSAVLHDHSRVTVVASLRTPNQAPELRFGMGLYHIAGDRILRPASPSGAVDGPWVEVFSRARVGPPPPPTAQRREGPGHGFVLEQRGDQVHLTLPHQPEPLVLLRRAAQVVSLELLSEEELSPRMRRHLREEFKSVRAVTADVGEVTLDGDLREWRSARVLTVAHGAQVLEGEGRRQGARDAGLVIGARPQGEQLLVAVRVSDDAVTPEDTLTLRYVAAGPWVVRPGACPPELRCAPLETVGGWAVELALPVPARAEPGGALPLLVRYEDHDPGQPPVTLANAPTMRALTVPGLSLGAFQPPPGSGRW